MKSLENQNHCRWWVAKYAKAISHTKQGHWLNWESVKKKKGGIEWIAKDAVNKKKPPGIRPMTESATNTQVLAHCRCMVPPRTCCRSVKSVFYPRRPRRELALGGAGAERTPRSEAIWLPDCGCTTSDRCSNASWWYPFDISKKK